MWNQKPSFRFEMDNFSEKKAVVSSKAFVSDGCEWYLTVYPKGDRPADGHLSLYLSVGNHKSLGTGWKRSANYYFAVLNQSEKVLYRSSIGKASNVFCAENPTWGFGKTLPLSKFQEKGFLEKDRLIIEVYIKVVEAVDGEGVDASEKNKTAIINGFQVFASQVTSARKLFAEHPDVAEDFKPKNQAVKTAYMNVLLNLINKLQKPPKSLSETKLSKASSELSELMNVGFKLDWLNLKLEKVSLEKKKSDAEGSRAQQLEERVKNLELKGFKLDSLNTKLEEFSLERKKSDDADECRAKELEKRVKNIELMQLGFKLDCLNTKHDEVSLERKKAYDADESRLQQLEERIKDLGLKLDCLNTKLEEVSVEKERYDDAEGSRVQQVEQSVKNLELMVSYLKAELDKKKDKSSADGFLLVDEIV